jgi:hypothetical protein
MVQEATERYLQLNALAVDPQGRTGGYDLVVTCSDLLIPNNIKDLPIVLVQEGMIDPEDFRYRAVRRLELPRYLANTSMTGLSHAYRAFCVASQGFRSLFTRKGVDPSAIHVTGIPNFDNVARYQQNDLAIRDYILAATSHLRETFKYENRRRFIHRALAIADGRQLVFKLHPSENHQRAAGEIRRHAPGSLIFAGGDIGYLIANCAALVTRYSSVILVALAMEKRVYSDLPDELLADLVPLQNGGTSAAAIADVCRRLVPSLRVRTGT